MSSSRLVTLEDQKNAEELDQNQVRVQPVALVQEDALVDVQHPHDVLQDHRLQDPLQEQEGDLQVEAPMVPSHQQEVQEDPKDLRQLPLELVDHLVGLHLDQCRQLVQHVVGPLEDVQVAFLHPPEPPVGPLEDVQVAFLHPPELPVDPLEDVQVPFLHPPEQPVDPLEDVQVSFLHLPEQPEEQPATAAAPHFEELQQLVAARPAGLVTNPPSHLGLPRYDLAVGHLLQPRPPLGFHLQVGLAHFPPTPVLTSLQPTTQMDGSGPPSGRPAFGQLTFPQLHLLHHRLPQPHVGAASETWLQNLFGLITCGYERGHRLWV